MYSRPEAGVSAEQRRGHHHLEHAVVLAVPQIVALQQVAPTLAHAAGELGQVDVGESQLLVGAAALRLLSNTDGGQTMTE